MPAQVPEFLVVGAFRYALGRKTYVVSETVTWLVAHWPELPANTRTVVARDLDREFVDDDAHRAEYPGRQWSSGRPLGMDMDRREWERVRALYREECADV